MFDCVLITDIGSVDPDDILATMLLIHMSTTNKFNVKGIIASHHFADIRAKLIRLMLNEYERYDIPVYVGHGINYGDKYDEKAREQFMEENPMFPPFFGYPINTMKDDDKQWYPKFAQAFYDEYGKNTVDQLEVNNDGTKFLIELLKEYSPQHRLRVICIAPPHDIAQIPIELYKNMDLYCMGGGFESFSEQDIIVERIGYNWGICPKITNKVLEKLQESKTRMTLISPNIVREKKIEVPIELYHKWDGGNTKLTKAIMKEWENSNRGNKLTGHKNIRDPLTVFIACSRTIIHVMETDTTIDTNLEGNNYISTKNMLQMKQTNHGNAYLVTDFDREDVLSEILGRLDRIMIYDNA